MVENEGYIHISKIIEKGENGQIIKLHLANYFRVHKDKAATEAVFRLHGLEPIYDPVRITPEIAEEFWEDQHADKSGFFIFPSKRLILGHTLEGIVVPADAGLRMRDLFHSEKTGEILPLTTNWGAPLIHPGSTGPQTYEIINISNQPLKVYISELVCFLDVEYLTGPSILAQQKLSKGEFGNQEKGKIKLGNPGADWEIQVIRKSLGLS